MLVQDSKRGALRVTTFVGDASESWPVHLMELRTCRDDAGQVIHDQGQYAPLPLLGVLQQVQTVRAQPRAQVQEPAGDTR